MTSWAEYLDQNSRIKGQTKAVPTVVVLVTVPFHWCYPNIYILHLNKACIRLWSVSLVAFEDLALFHSSCPGRFSGHLRWHAYFGCHLRCFITVLYYCFIHGAWTNYFNSSLQWGADWQLPALEWSVCFSDLAEAIWCILTIIGATATMMFSKPLCYFPGGCPQGIFE